MCDMQVCERRTQCVWYTGDANITAVVDFSGFLTFAVCGSGVMLSLEVRYVCQTIDTQIKNAFLS